jgi:hypothetical protein
MTDEVTERLRRQSRLFPETLSKMDRDRLSAVEQERRRVAETERRQAEHRQQQTERAVSAENDQLRVEIAGLRGVCDELQSKLNGVVVGMREGFEGFVDGLNRRLDEQEVTIITLRNQVAAQEITIAEMRVKGLTEMHTMMTAAIASTVESHNRITAERESMAAERREHQDEMIKASIKAKSLAREMEKVAEARENFRFDSEPAPKSGDLDNGPLIYSQTGFALNGSGRH